MKLILASTSVYRQKLLQRLGLKFSVQSPDFNEDSLKNQGILPLDLCQLLALKKAQAVLEKNPGSIVIGSDQVLDFNNKTLGKSKTKDKALQQLLSLQGQTHHLYTAVAVLGLNVTEQFYHQAKLKMKPLTIKQIESYLDLDQPYDCAGSYKIESFGVALFDQVETDDFTGIEGLPLLKLSKVLDKLGFVGFASDK